MREIRPRVKFELAIMLHSSTGLIETFIKRKKRVDDFKKLINQYKISYI